MSHCCVMIQWIAAKMCIYVLLSLVGLKYIAMFIDVGILSWSVLSYFQDGIMYEYFGKKWTRIWIKGVEYESRRLTPAF